MSKGEQLLWLALVVLGAVVLVGLARWIGRATNRPGLSFFIAGIMLLTAAGFGLVGGHRLLPISLAVQAAIFLALANERGGIKRARPGTESGEQQG